MTTNTTTTKKTTSRTKSTSSQPKETPVALPQNAFIHEILEAVSKQRTNAAKVKILKEQRHDSLVAIFIINFDQSVISLLPPGPVPYANIKEMTSVGGTLNDQIQKQADNVYTKTTAYTGTEEKVNAGHTSLRREYDKLYNFVKGGNDSLSSIRRETMFINILQGLHPLEAELLCLIKDKKLTDKYKISWNNVKEAYPDIVWGGRS